MKVRLMKRAVVFLLITVVSGIAQVPPPVRLLDLKAFDGTVLKASYFGAAEPGPGLLLLHQSNRARKSWDDMAGQLARLESTR
jgi:hypothetical protein